MLESVVRMLTTEDKRFIRHVCATKDDLREALARCATKDDLLNYPTKDDLRDALAQHATKDDLALLRHEMRLMFEDLKSTMFTLIEGVLSRLEASGRYIDPRLDGHDRRLDAVEHRVTRLEHRRP